MTSDRVDNEDLAQLTKLLREGDPEFSAALRSASRRVVSFEHAIRLATLRKRWLSRAAPPEGERLRVALVGGYTLYPLRELIELAAWAHGCEVSLFVGEYDGYVGEILDPASELHRFRPEVVIVMPAERRCRYAGPLTDDLASQERAVGAAADEVLSLCASAHGATGAEILLCNYMLPARFDPGAYRGRTLGSDWSFRKAVNLKLGVGAPSYVQIADLEFLSARRGLLASRDERMWFESKQVGSPELLVDLAAEMGRLVANLRRPPKKVLVLDLDNTLWGGVLGDDGVEGIEIGDTSPKGEAFKAFQSYALALRGRGVLLAVASKNDHARAVDALATHPEMVLRPESFAALEINWGPKSDSLRRMAADLALGLDSFVFVDDNPAEIEIVRLFAPEVTTVLLGPDPAEYRATLEDSRLFEPRTLTSEDLRRPAQYSEESARRSLSTTATNMDDYLHSLEMVGTIAPFCAADVPRIAQLVNKSNQFNLTTVRRSEAEVRALIDTQDRACFTLRLADRFGDHGLVCVVVLEVKGAVAEVDTWLMSCRVLNRQVEEETVNEIVRLAAHVGAARVVGRYVATPRNSLVRDTYPRMGFRPTSEPGTIASGAHPGEVVAYDLDVQSYSPKVTRILIKR